MRSDSRMSYKQVISGKTSTYHMDGGEPVIVKQPIDQSELEAAVLHNFFDNMLKAGLITEAQHEKACRMIDGADDLTLEKGIDAQAEPDLNAFD